MVFRVALRVLGNDTEISRTLGPARSKRRLVAVPDCPCLMLSRKAQIHLSECANVAGLPTVSNAAGPVSPLKQTAKAQNS